MPRHATPFNARRGDPAPNPAALAGLVERARDERFRLLAVMNDARRAAEGVAAAPSGSDQKRSDAAEALTRASDSSARLLTALTGLNDRLRERHEQLETAEARLAARLDVLEATTARKVEAEVQRRVGDRGGGCREAAGRARHGHRPAAGGDAGGCSRPRAQAGGRRSLTSD